MISREQKNKVYIDEIKREQAISISKKIFKIFIIMLTMFTLFFFYTYFIGVKGLKTNEIKIVDENIPNSFDGIKILHFSDILYGRTIKEKELEKLEKEIILLNPDIVIFTGDIIYNEYQIDTREISLLNSFFKEIPYTIGKYAVKGELDKTTFDLIIEDTNFNVLNNELINIYNHSNESISLIGININEEATQNLNSNNYTITLIHNYDDFSKYNVQTDLVLAGHNLGGEIRLFNIPLLGENKYMDSYYLENNTKIYISSGLGSIHHMRLFNKPSMNVYRLYNK